MRLATLGYALSGSILAVGIMVSFIRLDQRFVQWLQSLCGIDLGPLFTGSLLALLFANGVRFRAVAHGLIDSSFERIKPSLWQAAPPPARTLVLAGLIPDFILVRRSSSPA